LQPVKIIEIFREPTKYLEKEIEVEGLLQYFDPDNSTEIQQRSPATIVDRDNSSIRLKLNLLCANLDKLLRARWNSTQVSGAEIYERIVQIQGVLQINQNDEIVLLVAHLKATLPFPEDMRITTHTYQCSLQFSRSYVNFKTVKHPVVVTEARIQNELPQFEQLNNIALYEDYLNAFVWIEGSIENIFIFYSEDIENRTEQIIRFKPAEQTVSYDIPITGKFFLDFMSYCVEFPAGGTPRQQSCVIIGKLKPMQNEDYLKATGNEDILRVILDDVQYIKFQEKQTIF